MSLLPRFSTTASLEENMRLRLTHLVGELPAVSTRSAEEKIELEFANIAGAEAWVRERQIEMKWNVDRGRNVDPNKARKAKKAAKPYDSTAPQRGGGPKKKYEWTERYQCGHADTFCDERDKEVIDGDVVKVECQPDHNGHSAGTVGDMARSMVTVSVKQWIEERVGSGTNWSGIKKLLRLDALDNGSCANIPESLSVLHQDVYNALRCRMQRTAQLSPDGDQSLQMWKSRLEARGYAVIYQKNKKTGKGIPAAFMVMPSEAQYAIYDWLSWLSSVCKFKCKTWMIDCSDTESAAISNTIPDAKILACLWHVLGAVAKQAKEKLSAGAGQSKAAIDANQKLCAKAMSDFKALVRCESEEYFDGAWEVFLEQWKDHPIWVKYVSSEWLPKTTQWSQAWCKDISRFNINTNNYIESWHLLLKLDYLRLMRKQRVDILIYILVDEVELDLRREEVQITLGFDASRLQKSEKAAHRLAYAIEIGELEAMIENCEDGTDKTPNIMVQFFSRDEETWYEIQVQDIKYGAEYYAVIVACDCPAYKLHQLKCKHMFLAGHLTGLSLAFRASSPSTPLPLQPPLATSVTTDQVLAIKEAGCSQIVEEERKIGDLVGKLRRGYMQLC
ncbi:uncharacterized protein STEHIDRAFT_112627 [Stereum hirsutum FP-91666 SS1]|uniref:uncharacterized protein n=1 Tax=Stereum hirsutum (strain FP-91666) TaxID=721885 RepID=UPI0004449C7F|nr:uncharacterized protein STEHIDRAFT_112627 [Stereum hirsutum FP-91666 SS1]EIM84178.1 hypothetical protein STEHIDRAFT_112627 [Stereum hirsutum FP-91666 SS1]